MAERSPDIKKAKEQLGLEDDLASIQRDPASLQRDAASLQRDAAPRVRATLSGPQGARPKPARRTTQF